MALNTDLMGLGMADALARRVGMPTQIASTAAGTTAATATVLSAQSRVINMTASGSDGVRFNDNMPLNTEHFVYNSSGSTGKVYAPTGGNLNGGSTDAGLSLTTLKTAVFVRLTTTLVIYVLTA